MIESASSEALRCCASKSGGTYSASIPGVSGSTLINRTVHSPDWPTSRQIGWRAWPGRYRQGRSEPEYACTWRRPSPSKDLNHKPILPPRRADGNRLFGRSQPAAPLGTANRVELVGSNPKRPRGDESLQAPPVNMERLPVFTGEIDHHKPGGRQSLIEPLAVLDFAGCDQ